MRILDDKELSQVEGGGRYVIINGKKVPIETIDRHQPIPQTLIPFPRLTHPDNIDFSDYL
jgi:bacteriocin-like protein